MNSKAVSLTRQKPPIITTRKLVISALMVALIVVLTRLLGINTEVVKINFGFVPIVITAMCFGPVYCGVVCMLADVVGAILFPVGAFNPFFSLVELAVGLTYGLLLYRPRPEKKLSMVLIALATSTIVQVVFSLAVNTLMIGWMYNLSFAALLSTRLVKTAIMIPLQTIVIPLMWIKLIPLLSRWSNQKWYVRSVPAGYDMTKAPPDNKAE